MKIIKIVARQVTVADLEPGDLFSSAGPEHWDMVNARDTEEDPVVGEKVFIRTDAPVVPPNIPTDEIFLITIETLEPKKEG